MASFWLAPQGRMESGAQRAAGPLRLHGSKACGEKMMHKLVFLRSAADTLGRHLMSRAPLEEGAFCLLRTGKTATGLRLLVTDAILPPKNAWERQAKDQLRPSAQWLSAAIGRAIKAHANLPFVPSQPVKTHPARVRLPE